MRNTQSALWHDARQHSPSARNVGVGLVRQDHSVRAGCFSAGKDTLYEVSGNPENSKRLTWTFWGGLWGPGGKPPTSSVRGPSLGQLLSVLRQGLRSLPTNSLSLTYLFFEEWCPPTQSLSTHVTVTPKIRQPCEPGVLGQPALGVRPAANRGPAGPVGKFSAPPSGKGSTD